MAKRSRKIKKPYWQTEPCPSWCWANHRKSESGPDREHASRWSKRLVLSTMDTVVHIFKNRGEIFYTRPKAIVFINQGHRETSPRVIVENDQGQSHYEFTLDEAQAMAEALLKAVRLAGGGR